MQKQNETSKKIRLDEIQQNIESELRHFYNKLIYIIENLNADV